MAKILLIENDEALQKTYFDALKAEHHQVVTARDGQEGLHKFGNSRFDLVITDLNIPKVSGQKVIDNLRQTNRMGELPCPVLVCSGQIDPKTIQAFAPVEKVHFLPKPASNEEVVQKVKAVLTNKTTTNLLDVNFVNPIFEATIDVLKQMCQFEVSVGKPRTKEKTEISGDISGLIGLVSSGFKGNISLSFSKQGFFSILAAMLGETATEISDENKDAVAELLNIIFGQAKKVLNENGLNIQPSIPTIIIGEKHSINHQSKHSVIVIPFHSPQTGDFRIELSVTGN